MDEMTLGSFIADLPVWRGDDGHQPSASDTMDDEVPKTVRPDDAKSPFSETELLMFGAPTRRHVNSYNYDGISSYLTRFYGYEA